VALTCSSEEGWCAATLPTKVEISADDNALNTQLLNQNGRDEVFRLNLRKGLIEGQDDNTI
jgi:hypothetical protein